MDCEQKTVAFNSTAYRILKILTWLLKEPVSVEEMNVRFLKDPLVQKSLSSDSLWLYTNTLRALGCEIRRPSRSNHFKLELIRHPFGFHVPEDHIETLIQAKKAIGNNCFYKDILEFDRLIKTLMNASNISNPSEVIKEVFNKSRSIDYEPYFGLIRSLEQYCVSPAALLSITYNSPLNGQETFFFMPQQLEYQRGVLYLKGLQHKRNEVSKIRIERIVSLHCVTDRPDIETDFIQAEKEAELVIIHLEEVKKEDFQPFGMQESCEEIILKTGQKVLQVTVNTQDYFFLKQRLLGSGYSFLILQPEYFKADVIRTLQSMVLVYAKEPV